MIKEIKNVGRPTKTIKEKKEVKKDYNRNYYLTVEKTKRLINAFLKKYKNINNHSENKKYKQAIISKFSQYDFNNFFTGTNDPDYLERQSLELYNKKIEEINAEFGTALKGKYYQPVSIKGLRNYTEKYINHLLEIGCIDRAIVFYEQHKNHTWHTHILLNVINLNLADVDNFIENKWLIGICLNVPITDKSKLLDYCTKQLDIFSSKKSEKEKVLNWNILGNYTLEKTEIKRKRTLTEERIQQINLSKVTYNLEVDTGREILQKVVRISA